jgi:hypothetical protein
MIAAMSMMKQCPPPLYACRGQKQGRGSHAVVLQYAKADGRMNLFSWMNLIDVQIGVSVKPVEKMKISLDYQNFSLARKKDAWYYSNEKKMRWDSTGASGSSLADEIDLVWRYQIHPRIDLMAGCAAFFPGDFVKATGSDDNAYWAFGQIMIKI